MNARRVAKVTHHAATIPGAWSEHKPNETMNPSPIFDYEVYDRNDEKVGKVEFVWTGDNGEIGYLGISTGWLEPGQNHVIPGRGAVIDHEWKRVRVPFDKETIKASSSYDHSENLTASEEQHIARQFDAAEPCGFDPDVRHPAFNEDGEAVEVPFAEDMLQIRKRQASPGEVRLHKVVRTERITPPVALRGVPADEALVEEAVSFP